MRAWMQREQGLSDKHGTPDGLLLQRAELALHLLVIVGLRAHQGLSCTPCR